MTTPQSRTPYRPFAYIDWRNLAEVEYKKLLGACKVGGLVDIALFTDCVPGAWRVAHQHGGPFVAATGEGGAVYLFDLRSGELQAQTKAIADRSVGVEFFRPNIISSVDTNLVAGFSDGCARVYDVDYYRVQDGDKVFGDKEPRELNCGDGQVWGGQNCPRR